MLQKVWVSSLLYLIYQKLFGYLYIYNSTVRMFVAELLLNGLTELNDIVCMRMDDALDGLDSQIIP